MALKLVTRIFAFLVNYKKVGFFSEKNLSQPEVWLFNFQTNEVKVVLAL